MRGAEDPQPGGQPGLGLTQAGLASRLGVKKGALGAWESDPAEPSLADCHALAAALGLAVDAPARAAWDRRRAGTPRRRRTLGRPRKTPGVAGGQKVEKFRKKRKRPQG